MSKKYKQTSRRVAEIMELIAETCQSIRELTKAESRLLAKQLDLVNSVVNNPDEQKEKLLLVQPTLGWTLADTDITETIRQNVENFI